MYLIRFDYDGWCQGVERYYGETVLVAAPSYEAAKKKIQAKFENADNFKNMTIPSRGINHSMI